MTKFMISQFLLRVLSAIFHEFISMARNNSKAFSIDINCYDTIVQYYDYHELTCRRNTQEHHRESEAFATKLHERAHQGEAMHLMWLLRGSPRGLRVVCLEHPIAL
jgi:hypothetical protein